MPIKIPYIKGMPITKNEEGKYEYPNVEEYIKLPPTEKKKVYERVYTDSHSLDGVTYDKKVFVTTAQDGALREPWLTTFQAFTILEALLSAYNQVDTQEYRTKKAEKEGVFATSGPSKWDTFMKYGATGIQWAGQGLAGYEFLADKYNDYVDYKIDKASELASPRCMYDEDGNGTEKAIPCGPKVPGQPKCPSGQICAGGFCAPGCDVPGTYDFLRQMVDPNENISFKELADFINDLSSPVPPLSSCVIPHIDKFFNVIPWQYYLMKSLEGIVDELLSTIDSDIFDEEALNNLIKEQTVCGTEAGLDLEAIRNGAHLPHVSDFLNRLDFLPLPNIPYIPWPPPLIPGFIRLILDPLNAVRVLTIDLVCWTICGILNPIVYYVLAVMLREEQRMIENRNNILGQPEAMLPSALDFTMKKSDVNSFVTDDILEEAHSRGYVILKNPNKTEGLTTLDADHQHVLEVDKSGNGVAKKICHPMSAHVCHEHEVVNWTISTNQSSCYPSCKQRFGVCGAPPHIHQIPENLRHGLVRKYIEAVNYDEEITVKDLITLLAGSATCRVKGVLIKIGKQGDYPSLGLVEPAKILQFWQFLGNNINMFEFIESSKIECEPQVCPAPLSEELLKQLFDSINKACELMRQPETLSPLSQEDIESLAIGIGNNILKDAGLDSTLDKGNKENIIPSKTRDRKDLSEKCQGVNRKRWNGKEWVDMSNAEAAGKPCFAHYEGDDDEIEDDKKDFNWEHCGGDRKSTPNGCQPPPPPKELGQADTTTPGPAKCPTAGMHRAVPASEHVKGVASGKELDPCLYVNSDGSTWNSDALSKVPGALVEEVGGGGKYHKIQVYATTAATRMSSIVEALDYWGGTDKTLLYDTLDVLTAAEKDWICRRNIWPGGPNRHDYSLMYNICNDLSSGEQDTLYKKIGCKCQPGDS